ncbi:MAG: isoprenylcysteine carboxylmethyltransferase family protein [Candidatus Aminicenantes bacterium]|jgi:protein-S-isoprenylcysteine O-methyltransferase Ste14
MEQRKSKDLGILVKGFLALVIMLALMFSIAGRINYWQGWVFGVVNFFIVLTLFLKFPDISEIMKERTKPGSETKWWDKLFWAFFGPMNLAIIITATLDAGRFHWSHPIPLLIYPLGYVLYLLSSSLHFWAIKVNRFYTSTVSIQSEDGHEVIKSGPYRYIRHPGYLGIALMVVSIALVLGSLWAVVPSACVVVLLILRTVLEDSALQKELSGYPAYAKKVQYRLLPKIW